jgi:hypothetical protein
MNEHTQPTQPKRPGIITAICVLGFLGVVNAAFSMFSPYAKMLGSSFQAYFAVVMLINLIAVVGFWKMKKWGVILYALTVTVNVVVLWQVWHFKLPAVLVGWVLNMVIVIIGIYHFPKMD